MIALSGWRIDKVAQEVPHVVGRGLRWPLGRARTLIGDERILRTRAPQPGSTGRARYWVRTNVPLLDEPVSTTATAAGLLDIANRMTVRANPSDVAFPTSTSPPTSSDNPAPDGSDSTPPSRSARPGMA